MICVFVVVAWSHMIVKSITLVGNNFFQPNFNLPPSDNCGTGSGRITPRRTVWTSTETTIIPKPHLLVTTKTQLVLAHGEQHRNRDNPVHAIQDKRGMFDFVTNVGRATARFLELQV